jgi:hypothetical protein
VITELGASQSQAIARSVADDSAGWGVSYLQVLLRCSASASRIASTACLRVWPTLKQAFEAVALRLEAGGEAEGKSMRDTGWVPAKTGEEAKNALGPILASVFGQSLLTLLVEKARSERISFL